MCGIAGFIGASKNKSLTFQIMTKLFEKSEVRGLDASGYWATEVATGNIFFHKEPCQSSVFVKKDVWKSLSNFDLDMLLIHARGASKGVGEPRINSNNHPFTSLNKSIALTHNGRIDDIEYQTFKDKYELHTKCDSEILLKIFEAQSDGLAGVKEIFSLINQGHMAVAIGERKDSQKMLWLFRNQHRPLWIFDLRESLGQIFWVSETKIWDKAIAECPGAKNIFRNQKVVELPIEEIWGFEILNEAPNPNVKRYKVCREGYFPWEFDGIKHCSVRHDAKFEVITELDQQDRIEGDEISIKDIDFKCNQIVDSINDIRLAVNHLIEEKLIQQSDIDQVLSNLDDTHNGIKALIPV